METTKNPKKPLSLVDKLELIKAENISVIKDTDGHKFKFATLEQITNTLKPHLVKHRLSIHHELGIFGESGEQVLRTILTNLDDLTDTRKAVTKIPFDVKVGSQNGYQSMGSGITYFRRYHITVMFNLIPEDDVDSNSAPQKSQDKRAANITKPDTDYVKIFTDMASKGRSKEQLQKLFAAHNSKISEEQKVQISKIINNQK